MATREASMAKSRQASRAKKRKTAVKKSAATRSRRAAVKKTPTSRKRVVTRRASAGPSYKPADYTTVSPYLIVSGASATIDFLTQVLGATELRRLPDSSGRIMHAEVRIGDTVVMLADGVEAWPPVPSYVHVYVSDVDATYKRALTAGATSVQEPVKKQDEDKRGGVKDAGGTTWWIATKVE
jgi:uncharacterized glyoxalase superfamily protein PhnB